MYRFSEILNDLIIEKGLSLRAIEKESGIPSSQLSRYLKNTVPTINVAIRLAKYFKCSLDFLFGLTEERGNCDDNLNYDTAKFISRYQKALQDNHITHWKFSREYNFSESCLRHWKNGEIPKIDTLLIIAENLGVSFEYLLGKD